MMSGYIDGSASRNSSSLCLESFGFKEVVSDDKVG
jgi:hypothetical protein